jgi:hypothetical protein
MKKFIPWILSIVAAIVATWLLAWKWETYREIIERNKLLKKPEDPTEEALKKYKDNLSKVVEEVAKAEAEEMVDKWRRRFGKH